MRKLDDKFATVRGNILMQQPLPNLSNAFRVFSQEERYEELSQSTNQTDSLAFMAKNRRNFKNTGGNFGSFQRQNTGSTRAGKVYGNSGNVKK